MILRSILFTLPLLPLFADLGRLPSSDLSLLSEQTQLSTLSLQQLEGAALNTSLQGLSSLSRLDDLQLDTDLLSNDGLDLSSYFLAAE